MNRNRIVLYRPGKDNAVSDRQLIFLRSLFARKNIKFPFDSNREAKKKLSKYDASRIIDALKKGERINIHSI